ncbi:hypothetical protein LMG28614_07157 [Paraburkholderia ultramafica]|uniref:Uncharacterized protein n=1 Tax=Paraburkholderia ultramafica TaxID=1544867 RepID=A0A6S7C439_9BURK|nr:hypothetical protein LMG28614_07157 [Paraburkholderia ultramafica]
MGEAIEAGGQGMVGGSPHDQDVLGATIAGASASTEDELAIVTQDLHRRWSHK